MSNSWDLSCPDWQDRIRDGRSLIPNGLPIDKLLAKRAVDIFNKLRLPDVVGKPRLKAAAGDWFKEIVSTLFGSLIGGERMIRECFLLVPKKSSKTSYGAGLMVTALLLNQRPRAELLFIGPTKTIADLAFSQASGMIEADSFLRDRFGIQDHLKKITDRLTEATLQIKAFDMSVLTGVKPSAVLIDELHEISANSAATRIIGQIRGGLLPNPEAFPLTFITTQSDIEPSGAFKAELDRARGIRDGKIQGKMLPIIYELPDELAQPGENGEDPIWYKKKYWPMVNPNLGRPITLERLEEDFETAKQAGEGEIRRWASQHLNIEIGLALRSSSWIGAQYWLSRGDKTLTLEKIIALSEVLAIGIDGGGLDDLLSLCVIGREKITKRWMVWTHSWASKSVILQRGATIGARLEDFSSQGDLTLVENFGDDIQHLADICLEIFNTGKLFKIGLDPMGIGAIIDALDERGIDTDEYTVGISQGWKLTGAIKTAERKLAEVDGFVHCGQAINSWAVGNCKCEKKGNAVVITKQISGSGKIDPVMAMFDGIAILSGNPEARGSFYDNGEDYQRIFKKSSPPEGAPAPANASSFLWSPEIIQNTRHPRFQEHKKLYEDWAKRQPDEDEMEMWIGR